MKYKDYEKLLRGSDVSAISSYNFRAEIVKGEEEGEEETWYVVTYVPFSSKANAKLLFDEITAPPNVKEKTE